MRKFHNIAPKPRRIKRAMLRIKLKFWIKAFIACSRHDTCLQKEVCEWPEGFSVFFNVFKDKPYYGIRKDQGSLHIIKSPIAFSDDILMTFKSLDVSYAHFSGRMGIHQALIEKRFDIAGSLSLALSVIRSMILAERSLFRRKPMRPGRGIKPVGGVSRITILSEVLKIKLRGKEVSPHDSQILRVS